MKLFSSIREKIWVCVGVALIAYLITTGIATYSSYRTSSSLAELEETHMPLVFMANSLAAILQEQRLMFEEGVLTADSQQVMQAQQLDEQIESIFDQMTRLSHMNDPATYPVLLSLRDHYDEYYSLAAIYYLNVAEGGDIFRLQREVYQLGIMRKKMESMLQDFAIHLQHSVADRIKQGKTRAFSMSRVLPAFFALIFIIIFQLINRLSTELLVKPLAKIDKMIRDFGRGLPVSQPDNNGLTDEIESLSNTFWNMAEEHKELTVSRDYVDKILATMSDALVVLSPDLTMQRINQSALELFQVRFDEAVGFPFHIFLGQKVLKGSDMNLFPEILAGKKVTNYEMTVWCKDRGEIPVLFSGRAFYCLDGSVEGIVCLIKDISDYNHS